MSTKKKIAVNQLCLLYLMFISLQKCMAVDLLSKNNRISLGQTLVSANQAFELGFFSPGNSTNRYIGIWYKNVTARKIMWVANRKNPLSVFDNNSSLTIGNQGNLKILDGTRNTVWSTSINVQLNETIAQLTDTGCLYLNDTTSGSIVWESFDYPSNSLLPGMKLGAIGNTQGDQHLLTSWKNDYDATPGNFVVGLSADQPPQIFIWDGLKPHWRGGPWDGGKFVGIPEQDSGYSNLISLMPQNTPGGPYLVINLINFSDIIWLYLSPNGVLQVYYLNNDGNMWVSNWQEPIHSCDGYGVCGAFAICADNKSPICECLKGFVPQSNDEWSKSNWTSGCVRRSQLSCEMNATSIAYRNTKPDKFQILKGVKLPDNYHYFADLDSDACQKWCFDNCSCKEYAFVTGIC